MITCKVSFEKFEGEPMFPCIFIKTNWDENNNLIYIYEKAFVTECKIRTSGDYFKMNIIEVINSSHVA